MSAVRSRWLSLFAAALLLLGGAMSAGADQGDPRLDALFDRLHVTPDPIEAQDIEGTIWRIWMTSDDDKVNGLMQIGVNAMGGEDFAGALSAFTRMVEIAPGFAEGWNKRATVFYLVGDYAASIADIDRTLALEPRHFGALSGLGLVRSALDDEEAALAAFEKALAVNPHMPGARANAEELRRRLKGRSI
ncbi:MAG: tetratricopeptide repeat protein [Dongiaceae bacterium]